MCFLFYISIFYILLRIPKIICTDEKNIPNFYILRFKVYDDHPELLLIKHKITIKTELLQQS